ncbi:MAG TPA: YrhA family protein [Hymenobacter sp.]|jgi:hypothetical protein
MKAEIAGLIEEIKQERHHRRAALLMQPPASEEGLRQLRERAANILRYTLPEAYVELLGVVDGIDTNGFSLYASTAQPLAGHIGRPDYIIEGFVEANMLWRSYDPNTAFIFFAESGDIVYCHNLTINKFQVMDRIAQEPDSEADIFETFEELLEKLLNHMLNRYDVEEEADA